MNRETLAAHILDKLLKLFPEATITRHYTTGGCPMVKFTVDHKTFNITITRARK